jgi:hypothetical protein
VVCYKPSIVPCLRQEVLMRQSVIAPRLSQPTPFRPVASVVSDVAPEIQAKTIRLLARLLREHIDHLAAGSRSIH